MNLSKKQRKHCSCPHLDEALDLVVADAPAEAEAAAEVRAARPVPQDAERVAARKKLEPILWENSETYHFLKVLEVMLFTHSGSRQTS